MYEHLKELHQKFPVRGSLPKWKGGYNFSFTGWVKSHLHRQKMFDCIFPQEIFRRKNNSFFGDYVFWRPYGTAFFVRNISLKMKKPSIKIVGFSRKFSKASATKLRMWNTTEERACWELNGWLLKPKQNSYRDLVKSFLKSNKLLETVGNNCWKNLRRNVS